MANVVKGMDGAMKSMDLEKVSWIDPCSHSMARETGNVCGGLRANMEV